MHVCRRWLSFFDIPKALRLRRPIVYLQIEEMFTALADIENCHLLHGGNTMLSATTHPECRIALRVRFLDCSAPLP